MKKEPDLGLAGQPAFVPRCLACLVRLVCLAPRLTLTLTALSLTACGMLALTRLQYHTHRNDLISPDKEVLTRWEDYQERFGRDEDMVVVVKGDGAGSRPEMIAALESLAERISKRKDCFDRLFYKVDLHTLKDRALLFLPIDEIRRIEQDLERMRPLLDNPVAWKMFSLRGMTAEASQRLRRADKDRPLGEADRLLIEQLRATVESAHASLASPAGYRNPWNGLVRPRAASASEPGEEMLTRPQYFFSGDGMLAFLLVRPASESEGFLGPRESVETLRSIVEEERAARPSLEMGTTGLPVLELDEMTASQNDTNLASWLALVGVALLYLIAFRSFRAPLLTVGTLIVGTVWALGWTTLTVGHLNLLSSTFAIMLIGMGDYGVLWVTRYRQERGTGAGVSEAMDAVALSVGPSILTAAVTTALAFFAAMLADFLAVAELGWIAGCGVLLCALACFTFLPALIVVLDGRKESAGVREVLPMQEFREARLGDRVWLPGVVRRPRLVLAGCAVLWCVLAFFAFRIRYDHNLLNLQSGSLDSVRWERTLIDHTAGASWHALSHVDSREKALELKKRYEALPTVGRVVEIASLVPSDQEAKQPLLAGIRARLDLLPDRDASPVPLPSSIKGLRTELDRLAVSCRERGETELGASLDRLDLRLSGMAERTATERLALFERRLLADLNEDLHRLRDVSHPGTIALADLPTSLRERYVSSDGRWLMRVFGRESLWEYGPLSEFIASVQTVDPEATGKPFTTLDGLQGMKLGFQSAGIYALLAIVIVLVLDFRSVRPVLTALIPLASGTILALGALSLLGLDLNPANMIALPLIVGVGVDNGVHVIHDYLDRRRGRAYALRRSTGTGILIAGLTTLLGFGTLMLSSHRGLAGLGLILSLGVAGSMLTALVVLPTWLQWRTREENSAALREAA